MMLNRDLLRKGLNLSLIGAFGFAVLLADAAPSFAGNCGGHCQAGKRCVELVKEKGVKGATAHAEYNKCMTDPADYK